MYTPLQKEDAYDCAPRCVKMIFMYISERLGKPAPKLDIAAIGRIMETNILGTAIRNFQSLNRHRVLRRTIPSLQFVLDFSFPKFTVIVKELEANRPVIVYIDLSTDIRPFKHAVVVAGFDKEADKVTYNDPMYGIEKKDQSWFIEKWEKVDRVLVKIKIGEKIQRQIDEYFPPKPKEINGEGTDD